MTTAAQRKAARHAARSWDEMPEDDKAKHQRIARRWAEQDDLKLFEWANEYGVDYRMLFRAARSIGLRVFYGTPAEVRP